MKSHGVVTRVPGKVNLQLSVGPLGNDGFHEVTTVFQAISLFDDVTVAEGKPGTGTTISVSGQTAHGVPADATNLAIKAAQLMMKEYKLSPDLEIKLKKEIPVAGGMAGGPAKARVIISQCYKQKAQALAACASCRTPSETLVFEPYPTDGPQKCSKYFVDPTPESITLCGFTEDFG